MSKNPYQIQHKDYQSLKEAIDSLDNILLQHIENEEDEEEAESINIEIALPKLQKNLKFLNKQRSIEESDYHKMDKKLQAYEELLNFKKEINSFDKQLKKETISQKQYIETNNALIRLQNKFNKLLEREILTPKQQKVITKKLESYKPSLNISKHQFTSNQQNISDISKKTHEKEKIIQKSVPIQSKETNTKPITYKQTKELLPYILNHYPSFKEHESELNAILKAYELEHIYENYKKKKDIPKKSKPIETLSQINPTKIQKTLTTDKKHSTQSLKVLLEEVEKIRLKLSNSLKNQKISPARKNTSKSKTILKHNKFHKKDSSSKHIR